MPVIKLFYPNIVRIICEISGCMYIQFQVRVHWLQSNHFLLFMRNVLMLHCFLHLFYIHMFCYVWHLMLYSSNYHCSNSNSIFWCQSPSCTQWLIIVTITISSRTQMFNTKAHIIQTTEQHKCSTPKHPLYTLLNVSAEHLIHCDHSILCIRQSSSSTPPLFPACIVFFFCSGSQCWMYIWW